MDSQWYSKGEILNDLAEVTGTVDRANGLTTIHDRPPNKTSQLDDESELFLRMCGTGSRGRHAGRGVQYRESSPPDLPNIERMLKLLYESEDLPNHNEMEEVTKHKTQKIIISKLNPNVKEFIPNSTNNNNDKSPTKDFNELSINEKETKENNVTNDVVCKEKEALSSIVKSEIDKPKKVEVVDTKKFRKNVAMSSINTINANAEPTTNTIKLYTPDDFLIKIKPEKTIENIMAENLDSFRNETRCAPRILKEDYTNKPKIEEPIVETEIDPNIEVSPQEVQASINKVNNWLEPKKAEPTKSKAPNIGLITFKKKETVSIKSDSKTANLTPETSSQSSTSPSPYSKYKPSSYADELLKKFEKNAANALMKPSEDLWSKLQRELRDKDEELRKKELEEEKNRATPEPSDSAKKSKVRGKTRYKKIDSLF